MNAFVLNKRSRIVHRLPASESCNTDQIRGKQRFEIHASEQLVVVDGKDFRHCRRCFPNVD